MSLPSQQKAAREAFATARVELPRPAYQILEDDFFPILDRVIAQAFRAGQEEERRAFTDILDLANVWTNDWKPRTAQELKDDLFAAITAQGGKEV